MPGRLRRLSGRQVVAIFARLGFRVLSQRGSHVKLRRTGPGGRKETLVVPLHDELDAGTLRCIFHQALRYVGEDELRRCFYAE